MVPTNEQMDPMIEAMIAEERRGSLRTWRRRRAAARLRAQIAATPATPPLSPLAAAWAERYDAAVKAQQSDTNDTQ